MSERLEHNGHPCRLPKDPDEVSCEICGFVMYDYDVIRCEQCTRDTCEDCSVECAGCGRSGCKNCMEQIADDFYCDEECRGEE